MKCYRCGFELSEHDFCTSCGADVSLYKRIIYASNRLYNDGLEKARVRDLTGAAISLRESLKFNKNHIEARNLLGLVYFETGDVVAALSEWVISKNLKPKKNIADNYIDMVQSNAGRLETINQTIKKYNQAYYYCTQGSKDLAIIQLKKVLSMNPRLIRAHQLLALLYIDSEQWDRALKEVRKCLDIDRNNTIALRYRQEIENILSAEEPAKSGRQRKDDVVRYQSDNEIIIQPVNPREPKKTSAAALLNIVIGLVVGLAAMYFLVLPSQVSKVTNESNKKVAQIGGQLDEKEAQILDLQQQVERVEREKEGLNQELDGYVGENGTLDQIDDFLEVVSSYLDTKDAAAAASQLDAYLQLVDITQTSGAQQRLYQSLLGTIGPELAVTYYDTGVTALRSQLYEEAIANLEKAVYYDASHVEALYELGNAYRESGNASEAIAAYQKLVEDFPDSNRVRRAQRYIDDLTKE